MPTTQLTAKDYIKLGRFFASQQPDTAKEFLQTISQPLESDQSRIRLYYSAFCIMHNAMLSDFRGNLFKSYKVAKRRLFIACIVRMYMPHLHELPAGSVRVNHGIAAALAKILGQKQPNISNMIREVVVHEKAYPEFKAEVDQLTHKMMTT